jgi:hypothetical protein
MTLMLGDLYAALIEAGASKEKAMAAAVEVAAYRDRRTPPLASMIAQLRYGVFVAAVLSVVIMLGALAFSP